MRPCGSSSAVRGQTTTDAKLKSEPRRVSGADHNTVTTQGFYMESGGGVLGAVRRGAAGVIKDPSALDCIN